MCVCVCGCVIVYRRICAGLTLSTSLQHLPALQARPPPPAEPQPPLRRARPDRRQQPGLWKEGFGFERLEPFAILRLFDFIWLGFSNHGVLIHDQMAQQVKSHNDLGTLAFFSEVSLCLGGHDWIQYWNCSGKLYMKDHVARQGPKCKTKVSVLGIGLTYRYHLT